MTPGLAVPRLLDRALRTTFFALSRGRGRRIFHPHGVGFKAGFEPLPGAAGWLDVDLVGLGRRPAVVRLSRGAGLPPPLPDVLGLALRVPDVYGPGAHQDLLLATGAGPPLLRHTLLPGPRGFFRHTLSSILLYSAAGRTVVIGARSEGGGSSPADLDGVRRAGPGHSFLLCAAAVTGDWHDFARLELGDVLEDDATEGLRFNPWNTGGRLRPVGPLMGLRDPAYRGSQAGRSGEATSEAIAAPAESPVEGLGRGPDRPRDGGVIMRD